MKLREHTIEKDQCKCEIKQMRDLCMKLDKEKESLKSELKNRDERRTQVILKLHPTNFSYYHGFVYN